MFRLGTLELDQAGRVASIRPTHRDRPLLEPAAENSLPLIVAWLEGQEQPIGDWRATSDGGNAAVMRSLADAGPQFLIESVAASEGALLRVELLNNGSAPVQRVRFQIGGAVDIGPSPQVTYPCNSGWCVALDALGPGEVLPLGYPVHASMQWADLHTDDEGLYLGVQDPLPYTKVLLVGRLRGRPYLAWEYPHLQLEQGQTFRFPPLHLAWHRGDWRAGADLYRAWIAPYVVQPDPPPWYRNKPVWNWVGLRGQHAPTPWYRATDLAMLSSRTAEFGPDLVQLTAYTEHGHDTGYPDYAVGSSLGGTAAARQAVHAIHSTGRRVSIYANGRLVDPASSVSEKARDEWGVRVEPAGQVWQETYGQVTFDVMCPSAQAWNHLIISKLSTLAKRLDVDGIYIDQVCGAPALACYAGNHPHGRPNEAWAAYKPFMASLRLALRSIKADLFLATEGVSDLLGQYFDSMQSHEDWDRDMQGRGRLLPELYRYTFPHHLLNVGCIRANEERLLFLGHTLGSGFDFGIGEFDALAPEFIGAARWIVQQRARNDGLLHDARFCPVADIDAAGYRANAFAQDGEVLVLGAPLPSAPGSGTPRAVEVAAPWPYDHAPVTVVADSTTGPLNVPTDRRGDHLHLVLPGDRPITVLISARENIPSRKEEL